MAEPCLHWLSDSFSLGMPTPLRCSHSIEMIADRWTDEVRLSDVEPRFVCSACGRKGADVRPHPSYGRRAIGH
jgi:hypothetical protein